MFEKKVETLVQIFTKKSLIEFHVSSQVVPNQPRTVLSTPLIVFQTVTKTFTTRYLDSVTVEVELFTWEKLDYIEKVKEAFAL